MCRDCGQFDHVWDEDKGELLPYEPLKWWQNLLWSLVLFLVVALPIAFGLYAKAHNWR